MGIRPRDREQFWNLVIKKCNEHKELKTLVEVNLTKYNWFSIVKVIDDNLLTNLTKFKCRPELNVALKDTSYSSASPKVWLIFEGENALENRKKIRQLINKHFKDIQENCVIVSPKNNLDNDDGRQRIFIYRKEQNLNFEEEADRLLDLLYKALQLFIK